MQISIHHESDRLEGEKMNLVVFGASGGTGHEVVREALARGHSVTAFVRQPAKLRVRDAALRIVEGDVGEAAAVSEAIAGQDAVISTLGVSRPLKSDAVVIDGIRHIVSAMEAARVKRLLYQSFIGVRDSRHAVGFVLRFIAPLPLRHEIADHEAKESIIQPTGLDWTIARPPKLTGGARTGTIRVGEQIRTLHPVPMVSRSDVAAWMIDELERREYVRKIARILPA
jgi:putative NADH-flavin reductase